MRLLTPLVLFLLIPTMASAHFGAIIPSDDMVGPEDARTLTLEVKFIHPMEGHTMEMARPKRFGVLHNGRKTDLDDTLVSSKRSEEERTVWISEFKPRRPGDYTFFVEPVPYWEPAEDLFIVHYGKVCVNALGLEQGWDEPVGLETEIVPLTRPYGLWTGNLFSGQVLLKGKPLPFAEIEIEYLNGSSADGQPIPTPDGPLVSQVIKADSNGVFHYAMPKSGWWGFSALSEADWTIHRNGVDKHVEIGAVYWVHTIDIP